MMGGGWMYGGYGYSPFHGLWLIVMIVVVAYPAGRILSRMGFSPLWTILAFVPIVNVIALWLLAFTDWPARRAK
jgi:hypothetical protein